MTPAPPLLTCAAHGALAGWECTHCHAPLCPDCAATKLVPPVSLVACGLCGNFAEPLVRLRRETASLAQRLPGAFAFPFRGEGLPAFLGIVLWLWVTSWLGLVGLVVGWGVTVGSLFGLARSTARGGEQIELSGGSDLFSGVLAPLARFALAMLPAWLGAFFALRSGGGWAWWVVLAVTAVWSPTAFISAAAGASPVDLLNPWRVLRATRNLGRDFGVYLGALAVTAAVMVVSVPVSLVLSNLPLPFVSSLLAQPVLLYAPFVGARVAGLVLLLHGHVFGWGGAVDQYEPVLAGVEPRGALPERRSLPAHLPDAIELEPEASPAVSPAADRFAALELDPAHRPPGPAPLDASLAVDFQLERGAPSGAGLDAALLPSHGEQAAGEIRQAIARGDHDAVLDAFRAMGLSAAGAMTLEELVWVGQAASARIDYEAAELAFSRAAQRRGDAESVGRARVMLARLLAEKLSRVEEGTGWMARVVAEQPGTRASAFAATWLAARAG